MALEGLAQFINAELAKDLLDDLLKILNHSRQHIRKRVILVLHRCFVCYPDCIDMCFPRLVDKIDDNDLGKISLTSCLYSHQCPL